MSKRKLEISSGPEKKRVLMSFKDEWLTQHALVTDTLSAHDRENVRLGDIFTYDEARGITCTVCMKAKAGGDWVTGKKWNELKIDYPKRHLSHKTHGECVTRLRTQAKGLLKSCLSESAEDSEHRKELSTRRQASANEAKILIDNVFLAIKLNSSMLSVQEIHNHVAKYAKIPDEFN